MHFSHSFVLLALYAPTIQAIPAGWAWIDQPTDVCLSGMMSFLSVLRDHDQTIAWCKKQLGSSFSPTTTITVTRGRRSVHWPTARARSKRMAIMTAPKKTTATSTKPNLLSTKSTSTSTSKSNLPSTTLASTTSSPSSSPLTLPSAKPQSTSQPSPAPTDYSPPDPYSTEEDDGFDAGLPPDVPGEGIISTSYSTSTSGVTAMAPVAAYPSGVGPDMPPGAVGRQRSTSTSEIISTSSSGLTITTPAGSGTQSTPTYGPLVAAGNYVIIKSSRPTQTTTTTTPTTTLKISTITPKAGIGGEGLHKKTTTGKIRRQDNRILDPRDALYTTFIVQGGDVAVSFCSCITSSTVTFTQTVRTATRTSSETTEATQASDDNDNTGSDEVAASPSDAADTGNDGGDGGDGSLS